MEQKRRLINYKDYYNRVQDLLDQVDKDYDLIVPIMRGGIFPAVQYTNTIKAPMFPLCYSTRNSNAHCNITELKGYLSHVNKSSYKILITEDIIDSGKTLKEILNHLEKFALSSNINIKIDVLVLVLKKRNCSDISFIDSNNLSVNSSIQAFKLLKGNILYTSIVDSTQDWIEFYYDNPTNNLK